MATLISTTNHSSGSSSSPRLHLSFLDGIRAAAALLVVINHLWASWVKGPLPGTVGFWTNWLLNGHLWVSIFIVLSGFCLMLPVAVSRVLRGGWQAFYKSRARRILPPLYAAIGLAIFLLPLNHGHLTVKTLLANIFLLQEFVPNKGSLDGPLWSVAVEWKIYFLFPLFVWIWQRFGPAVVLLTGAVLSIVLLGLYEESHLIPHMRYACPWYVFLFCLGIFSADFARRPELPRRALPVCWSLLIAALVLYRFQEHFWSQMGNWSSILYLPINDVLSGSVVAALLFLLTREAGSQVKTPLFASVLLGFSWKPLAFVGTFAYSIYLIHILLIHPIKHFLISHLHTQAPYIIIPLDVAIILPLVYLFHLAFERPFMSKPGTKIKTEAQAEVAAVVNPAP